MCNTPQTLSLDSFHALILQIEQVCENGRQTFPKLPNCILTNERWKHQTSFQIQSPKTLKSHFQNESWKYQTSSTKYREDTKSFPPPPKSSLVEKVVHSPESCVELFGFVSWFDQIDLPFRLNKNWDCCYLVLKTMFLVDIFIFSWEMLKLVWNNRTCKTEQLKFSL